MRSWMALCVRPMRQKMPPKISADDTFEAARAMLVARSRVICRLHNPCPFHDTRTGDRAALHA